MMSVSKSSSIFFGRLLAVSGLLLVYTMVDGQEVSRSMTTPLIDSLQISSLSFDRILNTYIWIGNFQKDIRSQIWSADIRQKVRSRLIKTNQTAIQDEYQGTLSLHAQLSENWKIQLYNASNALADNRVIDLDRMAQHQVLGGFEYLPSRNMVGNVAGGYEINSQEEEVDKGFVYALGFDAQHMKLEEFDASLQSLWNQSFLGRRSPRTGEMRLILVRDFGNGVDDSLDINYNTQRREFYTSLDISSQASMGMQHNIFQRDVSTLEIMNRIRSDLDRNLSLVLSVGISNRFIDRGYRFKDYQNPVLLVLDSRIQEMQLFGTLSLQWSMFDWLDTDVRFSYTEKEERHSVQEDDRAGIAIVKKQRASASRLENTAQRTSLTLGFTFKASQENSIRLISSASILRYDTPDTLNYDDRDELLLTAGVEEVHRFSQHLTLKLNADLTLFHLVYLLREQSANNNWNRVLRLSPSIEYTPTPWFRTLARAEVLANYTVSDYEEQAASIRSFSFRQAFWSDSTIVRFGERIQCNFSGSLRIFERGTLRWKEFKERPEEYFIEKALWPEFVWLSPYGLKVGIGFRYFGQDRYRYQGGQRLFTQGIEAHGPTASIEWSGLGAEKVTVHGWREEQKSNGTTTTISNLSIQVGFVL